MLHGPERYLDDRCYMGLNITVMTVSHGPDCTGTLLLRPVLHGPERYRYDLCYMGPNITVITGVTWARTLPL